MDASSVPTIAYWMGTPIAELPRAKLERLFVEAREEIDRLRDQAMEQSISHVKHLVALARRH